MEQLEWFNIKQDMEYVESKKAEAKV